MKFFGRAITQEDLDNLATYMDDEIREQLHSELAPCTPDEFIGAYISRDPDLMHILCTEFDFAQDAYMDLDTGERWTELELIEIYEQTQEVHDDYPTWESYLEHMLTLGIQGIGGLVEC